VLTNEGNAFPNFLFGLSGTRKKQVSVLERRCLLGDLGGNERFELPHHIVVVRVNFAIGALSFCFPPRHEQETIATALKDIDDLIASLDALIAKKRDIKQAAMQQLLTGKTRLPGFEGEWVAKRLATLGTFLKGSGVRRDQALSGDIPCVRYCLTAQRRQRGRSNQWPKWNTLKKIIKEKWICIRLTGNECHHIVIDAAIHRQEPTPLKENSSADFCKNDRVGWHNMRTQNPSCALINPMICIGHEHRIAFAAHIGNLIERNPARSPGPNRSPRSPGMTSQYSCKASTSRAGMPPFRWASMS